MVTREMIEAGRNAYYYSARFDGDAGSDVMVYAIFSDMIAASSQFKHCRVSEG